MSKNSKFLRLSISIIFLLCTHCNGTSENHSETQSQNSDVNQNEIHPEKTIDLKTIQTEEYKTVLNGKLELLHSIIRNQYEKGLINLSKYTISVLKDEIENNFNVDELDCIASTCNLAITLENYKKVSEAIKVRMIDEFVNSFYVISAYKVKVQNSENNFVPIETLSSSVFLNTWAYKESKEMGPNCFHSALATADIGSLEPNFVSEEELNNHLGHSFHEVRRLEKFGDIVVLYSETGMEHAASFVGRDQEGREIVFTKNGRVPGHYMFMDLNDLMNHEHAYRDTTAKYYSLSSHQR